jgi:hypothetical protein
LTWTRAPGQQLFMMKYAVREAAHRFLTHTHTVDISDPIRIKLLIGECSDDQAAAATAAGQKLLNDIFEGDHDEPLMEWGNVAGPEIANLRANEVDKWAESLLEPLKSKYMRAHTLSPRDLHHISMHKTQCHTGCDYYHTLSPRDLHHISMHKTQCHTGCDYYQAKCTKRCSTPGVEQQKTPTLSGTSSSDVKRAFIRLQAHEWYTEYVTSLIPIKEAPEEEEPVEPIDEGPAEPFNHKEAARRVYAHVSRGDATCGDYWSKLDLPQGESVLTQYIRMNLHFLRQKRNSRVPYTFSAHDMTKSRVR